ncbi:hypothetical protein [Streptomyces sp. NPDC095613]|uniref:hypothetical protein n=1 Tax=Streptomyces sp. NPDC095613 TaxID=3155540 RepID=UPI00331EAFA6
MSVGSYFPGRGTLVEEKYLQGKEDGKAEGEAEGRASERAHSVVLVLEHRGIRVPESARERVMGCADLDILARWLDRAFSVSEAEELFESETDGKSD